MKTSAWRYFVRPAYVVAIAALAAMASIPACSKNDSDNDPRGVTMVAPAGANFLGNGYGLFGLGLNYTVQDPSNNNLTVQLSVNPGYYPNANVSGWQQMGTRAYNVQSYANQNTGRILVLLVWYNLSNPGQISSRAELWQGNGSTGAFARVKASGSKNWQDISQSLGEMGAP